MLVCQSPQKGSLVHMGKNVKSPFTEPDADGRPVYNGGGGGGLAPQGDGTNPIIRNETCISRPAAEISNV